MDDASIELSSEVSTEIDLPIGIDDAWDLVTDADALGLWLDGDVDVRPEVGAEGTIRFGRADDPTVLIVDEVEAGARFVFRWASSTRPPSTVEINLTEPLECPATTRIVIIERRSLAPMSGFQNRALSLAAR